MTKALINMLKSVLSMLKSDFNMLKEVPIILGSHLNMLTLHPKTATKEQKTIKSRINP